MIPSKPQDHVSHSLIETENLAKQWLGDIDTKEEAVVVALNGQLGSGKTTFVQAVARSLGVKENITSPTFVIMKKYSLWGKESINKHTDKISVGHFKNLIHIDAYRLESGDELKVLDFEEIVADPRNLVLIEWADNVKDGLPTNLKKIDFEYVSENERKISF